MGKMEAQLKVWDAKIEKLAAKAEKARDQVKADLHYHVDDLKVKRATVHARLDELRAAVGQAQAGIRASLQIAWKDLEAAFENLGL